MMRGLLLRLWRDRRGVSALEFALVAPFLVLLAVGTIEFGRLILLTQKLQNSSFMFADLAARGKSLSEGQLDDIFLAIGSLMKPFDLADGGAADARGSGGAHRPGGRMAGGRGDRRRAVSCAVRAAQGRGDRRPSAILFIRWSEAVNRLPILFVNRDDTFFQDAEHLIERRGCELVHAATAADVGALLKQHRFVLGIVNGVSARLTPESLKALHGALRRGGLPVSTVIVARPDDAPGLRALALPDLHVLVPPLKHGFLLELTSRLIGVGGRRPAANLMQVFLEDEARTRAMGFLENVSRHGLLARIDTEIAAPVGTECTVTFVLPGSREQNEVRAVLTRRVTDVRPRRYAFAFSAVSSEVYERLAAYVG